MSPDELPEVLTVSEVADVFGVGPDAVRNWADRNQLTSFRTPSGQRRFRRSDVLAFLPEPADAGDSAA